MVDAACYAQTAGSNGEVVNGAVGVEESGASLPPLSFQSFFGQLMPAGSAHVINYPVSAYRVYYLGAGAHTFHLTGTRLAGTCATGQVYVGEFKMKATYYPTSYGSVATAASSTGIGGFDSAEPVTVKTRPSDNTQAAITYRVDLRELELKAARAQAEAEKLQRQLLEEKLKQAQEKPQN